MEVTVGDKEEQPQIDSPMGQTAVTTMKESYEPQRNKMSGDFEGKATGTTAEVVLENSFNSALLDPPMYGWTAGGGMADLLPPHERARRKATKKAFLESKRNKKADRRDAFPGALVKTGASRDAHSQRSDMTTTLTAGEIGVRTSEKTLNGNKDPSTEEPRRSPTTGGKGTLKSLAIALQQEQSRDEPKPVVGCLKDPPPSSAEETSEDPPPSSAEETSAPALHDKDIPKMEGSAISLASVGEPKREPSGPLRFRAVQDGGRSLDIHAYHRGREGMEMRCKESGDLLCDVEASDTNYGVDAPKSLTVSVTIKFPLDDEVELEENNSDKKNEARYHREMIQWNLADQEMQTPMMFAAGIAEDFGLSFQQTLDLAESVQSQLYYHVRENCAYAPPMPLKMHEQAKHPDKPAPMVPTLYGEVTGFQQIGGKCHPTRQRTLLRGSSSSLLAGSGVRSSAKGEKGGKIPARPKRQPSRQFEKKAEDIYYKQVRSRLHQESTLEVPQRKQDGDKMPTSPSEKRVVLRENHRCHLCQQVQELCGIFPCGTNSHAYCINHLSERLGLTLVDPTPDDLKNSPLKLEYCPVCSLSCGCSDCGLRLDWAAIDFQNRCLEQNATAETTEFEHLLEHCRKLERRANASKREKGAKGKKRKGFDRRKTVPKIAVSDFPREVCNGIDLDLGFDDAYSTVFTEHGQLVANTPEQDAPVTEVSATETTPEAPAGVAEDGSVDYCQVCKQPGSLVCCDYCPRAFHVECLTVGSEKEGESDKPKWECPSCRLEKQGLPSDKLDGSKYITSYCSEYSDLDSNETRKNLEGVQLLSILHEMLVTLMDYDFGLVFQSPVDTRQIPAYTTIVEKPMDLGTILSNLQKGVYKKRFQGNATFLEDIALAVLKDVELVWHNCFIFNQAGSAVYRMAEVQRRRANSIRKRSFEHLLSERLRRELSVYATSCEEERRKVRQLDTSSKARDSSGTIARNKISVGPVGSRGRAVAILDPDTGRIVKIYNSVHSSSKAVELLVSRMHECEWEADKINRKDKIREIIVSSKDDAGLRLFGYRWLYLDELTDGKVSFANKPAREASTDSKRRKSTTPVPEFVELVDGNHSYLFNSREESLSFPGLPIDISPIRDGLRSLLPGCDFVEIAGRLWRLLSARLHADTKANDVTVLSETAFIKEDLISGRNLIGFKTVDAAYQDWLMTIDASPMPFEEERSIETFRSRYLDGNRNIDGISWRTIRLTNDETSQSVVEKGTGVVSDFTDQESISAAKPNHDGVQFEESDPFASQLAAGAQPITVENGEKATDDVEVFGSSNPSNFSSNVLRNGMLGNAFSSPDFHGRHEAQSEGILPRKASMEA